MTRLGVRCASGCPAVVGGLVGKFRIATNKKATGFFVTKSCVSAFRITISPLAPGMAQRGRTAQVTEIPPDGEQSWETENDRRLWKVGSSCSKPSTVLLKSVRIIPYTRKPAARVSRASLVGQSDETSDPICGLGTEATEDPRGRIYV